MDKRIKLIKGDITKLDVDAVVNAANSSLRGGGGVDGAIHRAAGPKLHEDCMRIILKQGTCDPGESVITSAGNMPSRYVIHTVGPVWHGGGQDEEQILRQAYVNSLELASDFGLKTIAFPNISTGIYGFPKDKAAETAIDAVNNYLQVNESIQQVTFCCFDDENFEIYFELIK